ncbi:MAG: DUF1624 domain-containing protein [Proteobacteria bacterium]|nr:MAG: DUF1624 domain-containing protein [Pseudomonadota bacterium]
MLLMALFHFCYDLKRFHVFEADFNESLFWIAFRGLVMGSFMLLVGISFWLAQPRYADRRYWIRFARSPWLPKTEDFAAVFPWLGVIFFGVFVGWTTAKWPTRVTALEIPGLSRLGRHALIFYMTHQLVLFPLAWLISKLWG